MMKKAYITCIICTLIVLMVLQANCSDNFSNLEITKGTGGINLRANQEEKLKGYKTINFGLSLKNTKRKQDTAPKFKARALRREYSELEKQKNSANDDSTYQEKELRKAILRSSYTISSHISMDKSFAIGLSDSNGRRAILNNKEMNQIIRSTQYTESSLREMITKVFALILFTFLASKGIRRTSNMKFLIFLEIIFLPAAFCAKSFVYTNSSSWVVNEITVDKNGDYFVAAHLFESGFSYAALVKIAKDGTFSCMWRESINTHSWLASIDATPDGNVLAGSYFSTNSVVKYGSDCSFKWKYDILIEYTPGSCSLLKCIDTISSSLFALSCSASTTQGTKLHYFYIMSQEGGAPLGANVDTISPYAYNAIAVLPNGLIGIAGVHSSTSVQCIFTSFSTSGNKANSYVYSTPYDVRCYGITSLMDGKVMLVGNKLMDDNYYDFIFYKINPDGTLIWEKTYGKQWSNTPYSIKITSFGYPVFSGHTYINIDSNYACYTGMMTPEDGTVIWEQIVNTTLPYCMSWRISTTPDSSIVVAGNVFKNNQGFELRVYNPNNCPPGKHADTTLSYPFPCNNCPIGTYQEKYNSTSCDNCSAGTYQDLTGQISCKQCSAGSSSIAGQTACTPCPPGKNSSTAGGGFCSNCPAGYFQDQSGSTTCKICPASTYSDPGQSSCTPCPIGTSQSSEGSPSCTNCAMGYFQDATGSSSCIICPAGTYQTQTGQSTCTPCGQGTFGNSPGQTSNTCQSCAAGTFQSQTGKTSCTPCIESKYTSTPGSSSCSDCSSGWYPSVNRDKCLYKGIFNSTSEFNTYNFSTLCFSSSVLVKPFTLSCRSAFVPLCCNEKVAKTSVICNFGLELQSTDVLYNRYCNPCAFNTISACPPDSICWNDITNDLHTNFSLTCLEYIAPYCGNKLMLNPNDTECQMFTNSCNSIVVNSSYGSEFTIFKITFSRMLPTAIPSCSTIFDLTKTPILQTGTFTCTRSSAYSIDVNISPLSSPISSFYLASSILKDACGVNIPSASVINIIPPDNKEVLQITGSTTDKCMGLVINSTITKGYAWPIITQTWSVSYVDTNGIPTVNLQRLVSIGNTNETTITISEADLFPNKVLRISSSITTQYGTTVNSNIITFTVPNIASGRPYCGPCQLSTRSSCQKYNGICWVDYLSYSVSSPFNTSLCLKAMASECYKIWLGSNTDDPQCLDFKSYYNFTLMKIKPTLNSAKYSASGKIITLTFSLPIYTGDFTDCGSLFSVNTANWLPQSKSGSWLDSVTLEIDYDPQVGIMKQLSLNGGVLRYDYPYAQEYISNTTISITLPVLDASLKINGLTTVSECDSIELFGMPATPSLHKLVFKWDVSYNTSALDSTKLDELNQLLSKFSAFNSQNVLSIPSQYISRGITIKATLTAKAESFDSNLLTTSIDVYVMDNTPKISFVSKSSSALELDGSKNSSISLEIFNFRCAKASASSESDIIPVDVEFKVVSGTTIQDITTQGEAENKLSQAVNNLYSTYKKLTLGASLGFSYLKFYNITAIIRDRLTGNKNSDNLVIYFAKPSIKCVIDQIGSLVNLFRDIELNGGNSLIPASTGDTIEYKWKCVSATILDYSGSCSCPFMDDSDMMNPKLILPKDRMKDMCKYVFSLIVIAIQGNFKRSARNETQFITFKGPIAPLQGIILKGTHNTIRDLYFTFALPQSDLSMKDSDIAIKWSLVEVKSQIGTSEKQYSMTNTFIYDFFTSDLKLNLDPSIKSQDIPVPENLTPKLLTTNLTRILGVDQASLLPQYRYTFGATVYYPSAPSIVFVDFFTPKAPRKRDLTITPASGVGFETAFRISFVLASSTEIDEAQYQIFRRNCPSNINETMTALTPLFGRSNSYVIEMAPGLKACEYQVEIIVRAFEYDDSIDMSTTVTVMTSSKPAINLITDQLNKIILSDMLTVDQRISALAEISNVNITEKTSQGHNLTNLLISELSKIDVFKGGVMDIMEAKDKVILLSTQSTIIASLSLKQAVNIDMKLASTMKSKISDYLVEVQTIDGGSYIIQSALAALSGIADIATNKQFDNEFFGSMQKAMQIMSDMKLKEMPPGAPVQTLASPAIDLVLNKIYLSVFDQKQTYSTPKNVSVGLPDGLQQQMFESLELNTQGNISRANVKDPQAVTSTRKRSQPNDILKSSSSSSTNRTFTVGSSIKATSFNPFETVKNNAAVNKNFINNASSSFVTPEMISNLYVNIARGRTSNVLNDKEQTTNIMQLGFIPFELQKNATEKSLNAGVGIGALQDGKEAYFTFPPFGSIQEYINSSVIVPLYYLADINKWTNENCSLVDPKPEDIVLKLKCSKIGTKVIKDIYQAFSITVDVVKDVLRVIAAGNYEQLINMSSFLNTGTRNITAYACILALIIGFILIELCLFKKDKHDLYEAKRRVLHERFNKVEVIQRHGTLYEIMAFFCKIKRQGFSKLSKRNDQTVHPGQEEKSIKKQKKKKPVIKDNGLSVLSKDEEEEVRDLYDLYLQTSFIYQEDEMEAIMTGEFESSIVLNRLTKISIDEEILKQSVTFCTLMRSEHPIISAFTKPEITTPRINKFLILVCAIVGELFVTGYFYNTDSTKDPSTELSENSSTYLGSTVIYSIAATLLMVPMKIMISIFLIGALFHEEMTREQIEAIENRAPVFLSIGFVAGIAWFGGCLYGILMYILNFPEGALECWMTTYAVSFFNETCIMFQVKILFKVIVGLFVFRLARSRILLTFIGVCIGKIVDQIVALI